MDLLAAELEIMATNAAAENTRAKEPVAEEDIALYTHETYAQHLQTARQPPKKTAATKTDKMTYLLFLGGSLNSPSQVQKYAGLCRVPQVTMAHSGETATPKQVVALRRHQWDTLRENFPASLEQLYVVAINIAEKDLFRTCMAPALGIDTTLPHLRPTEVALARPSQEEYPVWYFFYGTLGEPDRLKSLLGLKKGPKLSPASVKGGRIRMWGKYRALVDGSPDDGVSGVAYEVQKEEDEQNLRIYESAKYEVVRCKIQFRDDGREVWGLTFRFCGGEGLLS